MAHTAGVPHPLVDVTRGRTAAVAATIAAVAASAAAFDAFGVTAHPVVPSGSAVPVFGMVLLAVDAWLLSARRATAAIGTAIVAAVAAACVIATVLALPDRVQALLVGTAPLTVVGAAWIALGWRDGASSARWLVAVPASAAALVLLFGFDPIREPRCAQACASAPALLGSGIDPRTILTTATALTATAAVAYAIMAIRVGRAAAPAVVLATAGACIAAFTIWLAWRVARWDAAASEVDLAALPIAGTFIVAAGVLWAVLAESRTRSAAHRLTASLTDPAWADRGSVQFAVPGEERWIDSDGTTVERTEGGLILEQAGSPIARIPAPTGERVGGMEIGATQLLLLRNAQLAAVARARVAELQASRRRIVEIADAESRRIERDLHDGAQQRLVSSMLYLSLARIDEPELERIDEAETSIRSALDQLRSIAHGLTPEVLRTEGAWSAIEELVGAVSILVELELPTDRRIDDTAGAALHFGMADVVGQAESAHARRVRIAAVRNDGVVRAVIDVDGAVLSGDDGSEAADRIGALGGRFDVETIENGTRVVMEVPCES